MAAEKKYLSVDEFEKLMQRFKDGDKTALSLMVDDMQNLITWEIKNFGGRYAAYFGSQQLRQNLNCFLVDKINKYEKIDGGSFIKYFIFCLKKHFIDLKRELDKTISEREKTKSFESFFVDGSSSESLEEHFIPKTYSEDDFFNKIEVENIKKDVFPMLPLNYRTVAQLYYFENQNLSQIAKKLGLSDKAVSYRLAKANEEMAKIISGEVDKKSHINLNSPDKIQANRIQRIAPILEEAKAILDIEAEFMPLLTEKQKIVFINYIYNYDGKSRSEIMKLSGCKTTGEFTDSTQSIYRKLSYAIYKKKIIIEFLKRFSSVEECNEVSAILNERQRTLLNNYVLSLDYFAQSKTANLLGISEKTIPFLVKSLNSQIDYILTRKKMAQEFIEMNYGENFLLNVFGKTLSARQFRGSPFPRGCWGGSTR